jgi:AcrR family transcriptional regulator
MEKVIDRRTARTRRALHEALMSLILRQGYEAITVQDIIDEADVGRSTFYAHYTGKEDLLRSGFETLRALLTETQLNAAAEDPETPDEPLRFSLAMFEHACEYKHVYRALVGGLGGVVAVNEIRRILADLVRKDPSAIGNDEAIPQEIRVQFVVDTFITVLSWSLLRKPSLHPSRMNGIFRQLVMHGLSLKAVGR